MTLANITCPHCREPITPGELDNARFDAQVVISDGCWEWQGARQAFGYGAFGARGRNYSTHRWQWERYNGPIPTGMAVLHSCDNPPCVRPDHLAIGTQAANVRDKMAKGRHRYRAFHGEEHPRAKLTWTQVREIRARHSAGESGLSLARAFDMGRTSIYYILRGEHWKES